ncbi:hypothetical protein [Saccharopolyspora sp. ASAGF58]|uniref:hypothetical protein n=1 Tax=Saccharopolyspora sp. ASAGF58 TaxID=2719023 RepID=UPI00143FC21D|nr:hypothetical protein [Saccharopolyspora sp. ASAGF58]QIZ35212.1 hypothetical protein FDZ84_11460 [Saccharopolyspora sp. ASAGF58]
MSEDVEESAKLALARSVASVRHLRRAVKSQGLRLDPVAGAEIRAALEDQLSAVDDWLARSASLNQHAPLGKNPVGEAMAAKFATRADGHENSFNAVLKRYRQVLEGALDAIVSAIREYREIEERVSDSFRKLV